jgi:rare lipoprotein A
MIKNRAPKLSLAKRSKNQRNIEKLQQGDFNQISKTAISSQKNRWARLLLIFSALLCSVIGCATYEPPAPQQPPGYPKPYKVYGTWYQPLPDSNGFRQRGVASWYGDDFQGKKTSSGEIYDMYALTAAHKTLPLGTYVRVHNLENNRQVELRINDRGPFVRGRIIDLSYTAAKQIGIVEAGTARVEVVALATPAEADGGTPRYKPVDLYAGSFTFQVGAFVNRQNAERLAARLGQKYKNAHITVYDRGDQIFYRVRVGSFTTLDQAAQQEELFIRDGFADVFVVAE